MTTDERVITQIQAAQGHAAMLLTEIATAIVNRYQGPVDGTGTPLERYREHDILDQLIPDTFDIIGVDKRGHVNFFYNMTVYMASIRDGRLVFFKEAHGFHTDPARHVERTMGYDGYLPDGYPLQQSRGWRWLSEEVIVASPRIQQQRQCEAEWVERSLPVIRNLIESRPRQVIDFLMEYFGGETGAPNVLVEDSEVKLRGPSPSRLHPTVREIVPKIAQYIPDEGNILGAEHALQVLWQIHAIEPSAVEPAIPVLKDPETWRRTQGIDSFSLMGYHKRLIEEAEGEPFSPPEKFDPDR